jgi:hypothetical protein
MSHSATSAMRSQHPPKKRFKTSAKNPASNITSFQSLGLNFHEPNDNLIVNHTSSDGHNVQITSTTVPPLRDRLYTTVDDEGDWDAFHYNDENDGQANLDQFVFQVKKGRVTRVPKKKLATLVCRSFFLKKGLFTHIFSRKG